MTRAVKILSAAIAGAALICGAAQAQAQAYPNKPIRIVVPYTPGGFNDTMARVVGKKLQDAWGQPVIVDNRPGGGTIIGTEHVAKSAPDGYTLLVVGFPLPVNQYLFKKLPYDTAKDIAPIVLGGQSPSVMVVNASSQYKTAKDVVAAAKAAPGKLNYGSSGNGTSNHLIMAYFMNSAGIDMTQVPYKGSAPMVTALLGNEVDVNFDNLPHVQPHVKAGKMRALAITSAKRSPLAPNVPTVAELGWPGFEVQVFYGFAAPARTPPEIVNKLNAEINKILAMDDVKKTFLDAGVEPLGGSVQQFNTFFQEQSDKWNKVIREAKIQPE
ncbi:tripartite tricarboxylate transporter substrate binding protein [Noviherbaspirillum denitrificans]|uniref:MFS transporter n=1 Tax=Noviherbaspirillum denitrificans TaxID=1968433 RepID=A0A254TDV1_9BURK|nr:tripartite tricarboxylate transporter substrate binding protein [Noviherbaspirillum denitrificans]OWW20826.1 MFS transporter [Noviherbaspirillum denitrificans]